MLACLLAGAEAADATPSAALPDRRISISFDDLPWASLNESALPADDGQALAPAIAGHHQRLIAALRKAGVPVVGFVNEGKLVVGGRTHAGRVQLLRDWLDIGAELGNHGYGHADLHAVGLAAYQADILRGETVLRPLLAERGKRPRWFRPPYLRAGRTPEDKAALADFLAGHGYRLAPVTVDNSEWIWAAAYRKTLADAALSDGQRATRLAHLRRDYVPYMLAKLDYYEQQSIALLGYRLPQILLLHANELNAASYGELITAIRARGYRFLSLEESLRDPAYQRRDGYTGRYGPSWIHRWAIADGKTREFFAGEPQTAPWVLELAGVASE